METETLRAIGKLLTDNCFIGKIGEYRGVAYDVEASISAEAYAYLVHLAEIGVEKAIELLPLVV